MSRNRIVVPVLVGIVLPLCAGILQDESALAAGEGNAEGGTAIVYVIDNSTSMVWIHEEMKEILKNVIRKSTSKDSISIVFFGEKASTLASYKSIDEHKKDALCRIVDTASANSLYTCFSPAVERGVGLLYDYFRDAIADKYILLMVSDGKEHPPSGYVKDHSLEEVLRQHDDFIPGKDWNLCYLALREQVDSELVSLVKKYGGDFYNSGEISHLLDINEEEVVESIIQNPQDWNELEAFISDHTGQVEIKKTGENNWVEMQQVRYKLLAGDQIAVKKGAKAVITVGSVARLGLAEETTMKLDKAENLPLKQQANIQLELQKGILLNSVKKAPGSETTYEVLTPIALTGTRGTDFRVSYKDDIREEVVSVFAGSVEIRPPGGGSYKKEVIVEAGTQSVILAGNLPTPPSPIPQDILEEWGNWRKALLQKMSLQQIHFTPVIVKPLLNKIVLGPIKANQKYSAEIPLQFSEKYRGEDPLSAVTMISLPPGVEVLTDVKDDEENELRKTVHISLSCQPFLRYIGHEMYSGFINLDCKNPDIVFTMNSIPLQVLQKRPGFAQRIADLKPIIRIVILILSSLVVLLVFIILWKNRAKISRFYRLLLNKMKDALVKTRLIHLYRGRPVGHFVLCGATAEMPRKRYDLAQISRECNSLVLNLGSDSAKPFFFTRSPHQDIHCHIYASRKRNPTKVFIEPSHDAPVAVNGEPIKQSRQLNHKDKVEVGKLQFEFLDVQTQRQVRVHMHDGVQYTGILEYWDVSSTIFFMTWITERKEQFLTLDFRNVLYIEFFLDESDPEKHILPYPLRKSRRLIRKNISVFLTNKKKLNGLVDHKYRYKPGVGVFLFPPAKSNIQYLYVPGSSIESVVIVDAKKGKT